MRCPTPGAGESSSASSVTRASTKVTSCCIHRMTVRARSRLVSANSRRGPPRVQPVDPARCPARARRARLNDEPAAAQIRTMRRSNSSCGQAHRSAGRGRRTSSRTAKACGLRSFPTAATWSNARVEHSMLRWHRMRHHHRRTARGIREPATWCWSSASIACQSGRLPAAPHGQRPDDPGRRGHRPVRQSGPTCCWPTNCAGAAPSDVVELFRRMAFNALTSTPTITRATMR